MPKTTRVTASLRTGSTRSRAVGRSLRATPLCCLTTWHLITGRAAMRIEHDAPFHGGGTVSVLIRALVRMHRWNRMLEAGKFRAIAEIAEAEKIDRSFVSR